MANNNFHKSKKSAAVLKHEILKRYVRPFIAKTGSKSIGNRVAFIDGYAGPGRYDDGAEGSGAMLLREAREATAMGRKVECHFVEAEPETVARLRKVAEAEGAGLTYTIDDGSISTHLPKLLESATGIPLFTYLDPCGLVIPMEEVASIFDRPSGPGAPATEVLINLTAHLRRFAGMLYSEKAVEASLKRMDAVCDGDWWRKAWLDHCPTADASEAEKSAAEYAVVKGYAEKLRKRAGNAGTWIIDVRPRADLKPLYYLIFATRYVEGMTVFGEAASKGLEEWRRYLAQNENEGTLFGDEWEKDWKEQEKILETQWVDTLAERLTVELEKGQPFCILHRPQVVGDLTGLVRTLHFRRAINQVRKAGKTTTDPRGVKDLWQLTLTPV